MDKTEAKAADTKAEDKAQSKMTNEEARATVIYAAKQELPRYSGEQRTKLEEAIGVLEAYAPPEAPASKR